MFVDNVPVVNAYLRMIPPPLWNPSFTEITSTNNGKSLAYLGNTENKSLIITLERRSAIVGTVEETNPKFVGYTAPYKACTQLVEIVGMTCLARSDGG